jgi:hypothetical protein
MLLYRLLKAIENKEENRVKQKERVYKAID